MSYEDLCSGKHYSICKAYATFVAHSSSGNKVRGGWWLGGLEWSLHGGNGPSGKSWAGFSFPSWRGWFMAIPYPMPAGTSLRIPVCL